MIIAVDAMGGDYAPAEIVKGAALGSKLYGVDVILVGDEDAIKRHLPSEFAKSSSVTIRHTPEAIEMHEHVDAIRTKRNASVVVAADLVRKGEADAMLSMGNTAAAMAVATLKLRTIKGVDRPAIATLMPSKSGATIMLDAGAVVDCSVKNLVEFAVMGSIYAERVLSIRNPRVGLLSVGEEKSKGSDVIRQANEALSQLKMINFIGNVEGRDIFSDTVDVIVTDGFAGNVALKTAEGLVEFIRSSIKNCLRSDPLAWIGGALMLPGAILLMPFVKRLKKRLDYSEYGGAPLLGISGVCIIGHGRSNSHAVANAVRAAKEAVGNKVVAAIEESFTCTEHSKSPCAMGNGK